MPWCAKQKPSKSKKKSKGSKDEKKEKKSRHDKQHQLPDQQELGGYVDTEVLTTSSHELTHDAHKVPVCYSLTYCANYCI